MCLVVGAAVVMEHGLPLSASSSHTFSLSSHGLINCASLDTNFQTHSLYTHQTTNQGKYTSQLWLQSTRLSSTANTRSSYDCGRSLPSCATACFLFSLSVWPSRQPLFCFAVSQAAFWDRIPLWILRGMSRGGLELPRYLSQVGGVFVGYAAVFTWQDVIRSQEYSAGGTHARTHSLCVCVSFLTYRGWRSNNIPAEWL